MLDADPGEQGKEPGHSTPNPCPMGMALVVFVGQVIVAVVGWVNGYELHRDHFYYIRCGANLDWGYVDHTPVTPLIARLASLLPLPPEIGLGLASALCHALLVGLVGKTAAELGATPKARLWAQLAVATLPIAGQAGATFGTVTVELLAAGLFAYASVRVHRRGAVDLLFVGAVVACLWAKPTLVLMVMGTAVALAWCRPKLGGKLAGSVALGALSLAPFLAWQASRAWPMLEFSRSLRADGDGPILFLVMQAAILGPAWVLAFWRNREITPGLRRLVWVPVVVVELGFLLTGGKAYYPASAWILPITVGACAAAEGRRRFLALGGLVAAPAMLPILPIGTASDLGVLGLAGLNERVGWRALADRVNEFERSEGQVVVLTSSYGEADALWLLSGRRALCGHNQHAFWPAPKVEPTDYVLAIRYRPEFLARSFQEVRALPALDLTPGVENELTGAKLTRCRRLNVPVADLHRALRHFD